MFKAILTSIVDFRCHWGEGRALARKEPGRLRQSGRLDMEQALCEVGFMNLPLLPRFNDPHEYFLPSLTYKHRIWYGISLEPSKSNTHHLRSKQGPPAQRAFLRESHSRIDMVILLFRAMYLYSGILTASKRAISFCCNHVLGKMGARGLRIFTSNGRSHGVGAVL